MAEEHTHGIAPSARKSRDMVLHGVWEHGCSYVCCLDLEDGQGSGFARHAEARSAVTTDTSMVTGLPAEQAPSGFTRPQALQCSTGTGKIWNDRCLILCQARPAPALSDRR
ncbi:MAG: hypothetical protein A2139_13520 [Desulfobacca sp. RBG_16_60_12]|nr:MAG: hypothetical protein A2139_13520 [Desulfobacca sp. RBG_16_60_12]